MSPTRREFLRSCLIASSATALGCTPRSSTPKLTGSLVGASSADGHLLRTGGLPEASEELRVRVLIAGGGIAGLSAAKQLIARGIKDLVLCELERESGGNSSSGRNQVSAYPWGAHYVPVPNRESEFVHELFRELDLITSDSETSPGKGPDKGPTFRDEHLCHEPEERLLIHGRWQNGIVPAIGASDNDRAQINQFFSLIRELKAAKGSDGRHAFAIPLDLSSQDPEFTKLDRISLAAFLDEKGWKSPYLRWYTNYCCRDDYGTTEQEVSAWAGLHYFAGRRPWAANAGSGDLLTWPEGNGWLAKKIRERTDSVTRPRALVCRIEQREQQVSSLVYLPDERRSIRIVSDALIYAAPRFTAPHVIPELGKSRPGYLQSLRYAPWVVANVTVKNYRNIHAMAWDNVSFHSESLGYVVATHQQLERQTPDTVLSWYLPLSGQPPKAAREQALGTSLGQWQDVVFRDLIRMHRDMEPSIANIDICLWGHAMIRPEPGYIWGAERRAMAEPLGRIFFAHSDMSGISIFEEAQYHGITTANRVASILGT